MNIDCSNSECLCPDCKRRGVCPECKFCLDASPDHPAPTLFCPDYIPIDKENN